MLPNVSIMELKELQKLVGAKIREFRLKKGCTQIQLTVKIIELGGKMDATNISRMESGRTNITLFQLHRISEALEIPMKDFLDFELPKE